MRVPTYDNFQVDTGAAPVGRFAPPPDLQPSTTQVGPQQIQGEQMQTMGNAVQKSASAVVQEMIVPAQIEANRLRVIEGVGAAKTEMVAMLYDPAEGVYAQTGRKALERESGVPLPDEYAGKFNAKIQAIRDGLSNDAQKQAFMHYAADIQGQLQERAVKHVLSENQKWTESVHVGAAMNAADQIMREYSNPLVIDKNIGTVRGATKSLYLARGASEVEADARASEAVSGSIRGAIGMAALRGDAALANDYLNRYSGQMVGSDIAKAYDVVSRAGGDALARGAVDRTFMKLGPQIATNDLGRLANIMWGLESAGQHFGGPGSQKNGNAPTTSAKGATGLAQIMPDTGPEAARLAGLKWDPELFNRGRTGDPVKDREATEYNRALGAAYLNKQLQDFGGRVDLAVAAYNAGPVAVRDFMNGTNQSGKNPDKIKTSDGIPPWKETQAYVRRTVNDFMAGKGQGGGTLKDVVDGVVAELPNATPQTIKIAVDQATKRFNDLQNSQYEREGQATVSAVNALVQNGGDFNALPPEVKLGVPASRMDRVLKFAGELAAGTHQTNLAVYEKLSEPGTLTKLSDTEFGMLRADLDAKDFALFSSLRQQAISGAERSHAGSISTGEINDILANRFRQIGIDPTPADSDKPGHMRLGAIKKFVYDSVLEAQARSGKRLDDMELQAHIDKLFMRDYKFKNTVMGLEFGGTQKQTLLAMRYGDIPPSERTRIERSLKARGVENPTPADVFGVFLRIHGQDNAAGAAKRALVPVNTGGAVVPATSASQGAGAGYSLGEYGDATRAALGEIISYRPDPQYVEEDARASAKRMAFGKGLGWGDVFEKVIVDPMILNKR